MNEPEQIKDQKLLPPATLTEEDEFYAKCNINGINLVDRVNGKPVWVYPYWIDRPNCNWKAPRSREEEDDDDWDWDDGNDDAERNVDESVALNEDKDAANKKGLISRLTYWWQQRHVIN
jgi:hypothetical protein